eukprot:CAMPEP_0202729322 /NCGR_PEP_ID=MMETSP1385-20130828/186074_1 /ASSEMBLY_ACC=CAM_ASM_000861 /TAXON_ID=933848 /ORGANISM="Elphidium margaritaceum" /LENGTH=1427 /DNA_ID=CAMNT_0049395581 /DNA_START=30 /DNA_END=4312 /DNA_ORIENTATION=+
MTSFQTRKSAAPPPPTLSELWQRQPADTFNNDAPSISTANDLMDDDELYRIQQRSRVPSLQVNNSDDSDENKTLSSGTHRRSSVTKEYARPKPPLHAHQSITTETTPNYDAITKNNPYTKKPATFSSPSKRVIRPINSNVSRTGKVRTIVKLNHHKTESKTLDAFLRNRTPENELQQRRILPAQTTNENPQQFWSERQQHTQAIRSNLNRRLSQKFRPNATELYDRGIYVTNPKEQSDRAAWTRADTRRRHSQLLKQKFAARPKPSEVLKQGIIRHDDFSELFNAQPQPQTQPPTPTHNFAAADASHANSHGHTAAAPTNMKQEQKLAFKIKQRPTINEMKSRGLMYEDPAVPASLQNRKRELHRRRASRKLEQFLVHRPKAEILRQRRIIVSPREETQQRERQQKTDIKRNLRRHIKQRPSMDMLRKKRIFNAPPPPPQISSSPSPHNTATKNKKTKKKIWIAGGQVRQSKRRESLTISDFLQRRPKANNLVHRHILPSEYLQQNHLNFDHDAAQAKYTRRRKQSRIDLEQKMNARLEIDALPYKYFVPTNDADEDTDTAAAIAMMRKEDVRATSFESDTNMNNNKTRKRVASKTRESWMLEQFLPVRPDVQKLWDKNILPSLPPSPQKTTPFMNAATTATLRNAHDSPMALASAIDRQASLFRFGTASATDLFNVEALNERVSALYAHQQSIDDEEDIFAAKRNNARSAHQQSIDDEEDIFAQNETMQGLAQPALPGQKPRIETTNVSSGTSNTISSSGLSPITPQRVFVDKRRNRRQESMAALEMRLVERAPRESLFELGILRMSPAPSPPPFSVIQQTKQNLPRNNATAAAPPDYSSIFEPKTTTNMTPSISGYDEDDDVDEEFENLMAVNMKKSSTKNGLEPTRKKRRLMNGENTVVTASASAAAATHKKKDSLVLTDFLGAENTHKLETHLGQRPTPMQLIHRGIVPTYSFTKNFSTPTKFARHRRNMTLELQTTLEQKLKSRPMLNDLPKKIYLVESNLQHLLDTNKITTMDKSEIDALLQELARDHERNLEDMKQRYWSMLVEQKDRYKQLERTSTNNEITMRQKLEAMSTQCQSLSTSLIESNTQLKQQSDEFEARLARLQHEHRQEWQRQQTRLQLSDDTQRTMREEMQKQQEMENKSLRQILHQDRAYVQQQQQQQPEPGKLSDIEHRIDTIEKKFQSELQRERSIHRKLSEQSERIKQTLVDEINKMEQQHRSRVHELESQMKTLKAENRVFAQTKEHQVTQLTQKYSSEIDKERNIASIMVESLDEEKTRLAQEMERLKLEYESKLEQQNTQITQLRQVAQDAVYYGNKALQHNNHDDGNASAQKKRGSVELSAADRASVLEQELRDKTRMVAELQTQLRQRQTLETKCRKLQQNKTKLEQQVLMLSQQIIDAFANGLNDDGKRSLKLRNGYNT